MKTSEPRRIEITTHTTEAGLITARYKEKLHQIIHQVNPQINLSFDEVDYKLQMELDNWDGNDCLVELFLEYCDYNTTYKRLLISASNKGKYAQHCSQKAVHAKWGGCLGGVVAVDYAPNEKRIENQLHESLGNPPFFSPRQK